MKTPKEGFPEYCMSPEILEGEIFKPIPGASAEASNMGRIRRNGRILHVNDNSYNGTGYFRICAKIGIKERYVHRLVHLAWFGEIPKDCHGKTCVVDHLDGNRHNNRIDNLCSVDNRRNILLASKSGSFNDKGCGKRKRIKATHIKDGSEFYFKSQCEAERILKIPNCSINKALKGERGTCRGYKWEYCDN